MNNAKYKIRYSQRTALTLIELIVAVALMVMIIAGIGYVFSSTSKTVSASRNASEINSSIRAMTLQISDDFRMLDKDGFLAIVGATANTPPVLMFTVTGLFEPIRIPATWTSPRLNADKTTNSAVIMYTLARVPYIPTSTPDRNNPGQLALVRYVYRLVGSSEFFNGGGGDNTPVFIGDLIAQYRMGGLAATASEAMACGDFMFASLPNIQALPINPSASGDLFKKMLYPFLYAFAASSPMGWPEIDVDPADMEGVEQLWPYLLGGLPDSPDAMKVDFYDGKNDQGTTYADTVALRNSWLDITDYDDMETMKAGFRNKPVTNKCIANIIAVNGVDYPVVIWSGQNKDVWPQQLRFRMQLTNIANEANAPRNYELVLPVR